MNRHTTQRSALSAPSATFGRLRIALIGVGAVPIPPTGWGAVEEYIASLSGELRRLGHDVSIINRVPLFRSPRLRELAFAASLPRELRGRSFDVLHAHSPITAEALRIAGRPYVFTSHSRYWISDLRPFDRVRRVRDVLAVRRALAVVALTPRLVPVFRRIRPDTAEGARVAYVPFGVDGERFKPLADPRDRTGVVGLGVVAPHKRFDVLAAAARRAGVPATIIGPAPAPRIRSELTRIDPELRITGEVPAGDLADVLAHGRIFVHPSDMELASVATIQAMACGLQVVGSDQIAGIVTHGHDGFIVPHRLPRESRVSQTAAYIEQLTRDDELWRTMGANARRTVLENHAWDGIARRIVDLYGRALAPG